MAQEPEKIIPKPPVGRPLNPNAQPPAVSAQQQLAQAQAQAEIERLKAAAKTAPMAAAVIKHVWTREDTYASLAQKYYGSTQEPYWRLIYNHNQAKIGKNPNDIRVGLEIEIPSLPEELKKK
jgi:nucleoid-associated protein YgaU